MDCPNCKLFNADSALRCDCGYEFASGRVVASNVQRPPQELAGLTERLFGQVLDAVIAYSGLVLVSASGGARPNNPWLILMYTFAAVYLLLSDGLDGRSIGKRVLGTIVVDAITGKPCTFGQSFVRNLFIGLNALDWIFIFGARRQRLGDKVANTIVVVFSPPRAGV